MSAVCVNLSSVTSEVPANTPNSSEHCASGTPFPSYCDKNRSETETRLGAAASKRRFSLPCGASDTDDLNYGDNNSNSGSMTSIHGSASDFTSSNSNSNGLSKSIEDDNHVCVQDTRFLESCELTLDGNACPLHASSEDSTQRNAATTTGASKSASQHLLAASGNTSVVRVVPNPHMSSPVPVVVCAPFRCVQRPDCFGTGHLAEFDGGAPHAVDEVLDRTSPLDPPRATAMEVKSYDISDASVSSFDSFTEAFYTVQRSFSSRVTKSPEVSELLRDTHVLPSLKETDVADIFQSSCTYATTNTLLKCEEDSAHGKEDEDQRLQHRKAALTMMDTSLLGVPTSTYASHTITGQKATAPADGEGKDHLTPARSTTCLTTLYNRILRNSRRVPQGSGRRLAFSSSLSAALSPLSSIPPMNVAPQAVVDHFHDVYRSATPATATTTTATTALSEAVGAISSSSAMSGTGVDDVGTNLIFSPTLTEVKAEMENHDMCAETNGCSVHPMHSFGMSDEDGPPLLACTRRQSLSESSSNQVEVDADDCADAAATAFPPFAATPPRSVEVCSEVGMSPVVSAAHVDPVTPSHINTAKARSSSAVGACGYNSSHETSITAAFAPARVFKSVKMTDAPENAPAWLSQVRQTVKQEDDTRSSCCDSNGGVRNLKVGAEKRDRSTRFSPTSSPAGKDDKDRGLLPTSPPSPPFTATKTPSPKSSTLCVTPPEKTATTTPTTTRTSRANNFVGAKPSSLPRRPPRALFSNLPSPQQSSLVDSAFTLAKPCVRNDNNPTTNAVTDHRAQECSGSDFAAIAEPFETTRSTGHRDHEGNGSSGTGGCCLSPPTSLPTSPDEVDLAQLVQQHVSQRIAQSYAQSCSYYLHYHSKPGSIVGGNGAYSYPNSPVAYRWDDEDLEEAAELHEVPRMLEDSTGSVATSTTTTTTSTAAMREGAAATTEQPVSSRADPFQQQPRWRRFSYAVPRTHPM